MFQLGDIVALYAPTAGHDKYHLCIKVGADGAADQFLFLNSRANYAGVFVTTCDRVPCIPASTTGNTCVSFNMIPRYNDTQLRTFRANKLGEIDIGLAADLYEFASDDVNLKALVSTEKAVVRAALKSLAKL